MQLGGFIPIKPCGIFLKGFPYEWVDLGTFIVYRSL
jgi:hypothetical protein